MLQQLLQPQVVVGDTILGLPMTALQARGITALLLDIDDTLVPLRDREVPVAVTAWVAAQRAQFQMWLVSNNWNQQSISRIASQLNLPYINRAGKPSRRALKVAIANMQVPRNQVAMVGDRLWTDVLAANRLGVVSVLVDPLSGKGASLERGISRLWGINLKKTLWSEAGGSGFAIIHDV